jgi:hypothetical protein
MLAVVRYALSGIQGNVDQLDDVQGRPHAGEAVSLVNGAENILGYVGSLLSDEASTGFATDQLRREA